MTVNQPARWNHNIHYHALVLNALPEHCSRALDVGCGEGELFGELLSRVPHVVGMDRHLPSLDRARQAVELGATAGKRGALLLGDLLASPLRDESFDFVTSIAMIHHVDATAGLSAMADLVRPGGVLAVLGLARSHSPIDYAYDAAGFGAGLAYRVSRERHESGAPKIWPPPLTYREMRDIARGVLPGCEFKRLVSFRYFIRWSKPR